LCRTIYEMTRAAITSPCTGSRKKSALPVMAIVSTHMYKNLIRLIILVLLLVVCSVSFAEEKKWKYFVAMSGIDKWSITEGDATVSMKGNIFAADLYLEGDVQFRVRGTIKNSMISVKFAASETCLVDYPLKGRYVKTIWKEGIVGSRGRETIELNGDGIVVGLTREID